MCLKETDPRIFRKESYVNISIQNFRVVSHDFFCLPLLLEDSLLRKLRLWVSPWVKVFSESGKLFRLGGPCPSRLRKLVRGDSPLLKLEAAKANLHFNIY